MSSERPSRTSVKLVSLVTALLIVGAALAPVAVGAVWWNSSGSPLTVTGYGSTGKGYGKLAVTSGGSGTVYSATTYQKISNADNHKVYAQLTYYSNSGVCFAPSFAQCTSQYYVHASDNTEATSSSSYVTDYESAPIDGYASYHRLRARMILAIPYRPDPGSGYSWTPGLEY